MMWFPVKKLLETALKMASTLPFPIATGKKKPVQVFECPQESWKSKKSAGTKSSRAQDKQADTPIDDEIRKELNDAYESVKQFAAENLKGKEKKQHEAKRIELLGGRAAKNRSSPYHILSAIKKARVVREARKEELNRQADVVSGKRKRGKAAEKKEKKKNMDYGVQATLGKFRNGVLNVARLK